MNKTIISIGALGGSGTRVVAEIFIQLGIFMGNDLNESNDNLVFTRLFKNPIWYRNATSEEKQLRLKLFNKCMTGEKLRFQEQKELFFATRSNPTHKTALVDCLKMVQPFSNTIDNVDGKEWGWKEPNSHIYITEILEQFPSVKYIHVLRNGLDMAFSKNKQQLKNWGWKYGVEVKGNESESQLEIKQLEYWIATTKEIFELYEGNTERMYILNFSNLCLNPKKEIDELLEFCNLAVHANRLDKIYQIPNNTGSNDRYKNYDLSIFSKRQLEYVKKVGFEI